MITERCPILCIYHIFIIHSSVVGSLSCFHSLDSVGSTAVNISNAAIPLHFVDRYLGLELLNHTADLFSICWEIFLLHSIRAGSFYISTKNIWGFILLHFLKNTHHFWSFQYWPSSRVWDVISLWFDLCFSDDKIMSIFLYAFWSSICFSGERLVHWLIDWLILIELYKFLVDHGYCPLVQCILNKYFFSFSRDCFNLINSFFCCTKANGSQEADYNS